MIRLTQQGKSSKEGVELIFLREYILKIAKKAKYSKFPAVIKKIVLVVFVILIFDILVAGIWTFLDKGNWFFSDKSQVRILSDLLFIEGAITFAVGAFIALGMSKTMLATCARVMIIGASLMGSSMAIGMLLL